MKRRINQYLAAFLIFLMAIMTLDVLWGVFTRYVLNNQASWSEELARFLLIWVGILGAAYASGQKLHLSIDLLQPRLTIENQKRLSVLINLLIIGFALTVMVIGGFRLMYLTSVLGQTSAALRIPIASVYVIIPISGLLIIYYKVSELLEQPA